MNLTLLLRSKLRCIEFCHRPGPAKQNGKLWLSGVIFSSLIDADRGRGTASHVRGVLLCIDTVRHANVIHAPHYQLNSTLGSKAITTHRLHKSPNANGGTSQDRTHGTALCSQKPFFSTHTSRTSHSFIGTCMPIHTHTHKVCALMHTHTLM